MIKRKFTKFSVNEIKKLFIKSKKILFENGIEIKQSFYCTEKGRLLILTPKKLGNAPYRNYLRRCSKEIFKNLNLKNDFIIGFKKANNKISFLNIKNFFKKII